MELTQFMADSLGQGIKYVMFVGGLMYILGWFLYQIFRREIFVEHESSHAAILGSYLSGIGFCTFIFGSVLLFVCADTVAAVYHDSCVPELSVFQAILVICATVLYVVYCSGFILCFIDDMKKK